MRRLFSLLAAVLLSAFSVRAQSLSVSTNLAAYARLGTLNVEGGYAFSRHWSCHAGLNYNPFSFRRDGHVFRSRERSVRAGMRAWPWHRYSGWWMGAGLRWQEYNRGGFRSPETTEGDRLGAGLSVGYAHMLNAHFNLELGLGVWAGQDRYRRYACPECGVTEASGSKLFLLPDEWLLALTYIF